jgi:cation:H+ antiporter
MPAWLAVILLVVSVVATLAAAGLFARRLDRLGHQLGIAEPLVGLITALAADAPELSSGAAAIARGHRDVGVGVLVGSNMFNLAAMIGLSAILAGSVRLDRSALVREGAVAMLAIGIASAVLAGVLPPWLGLLVTVAAGVPYLRWLARPGGSRRGARPWPWPWREGIAAVPRAAGATAQIARLFVLELPALAIIVLGSVGMVVSAVSLAGRLGVSQQVVGLVVLAILTSLPNAYTAVRLGLAGRASALVSETLNSNTINLLGGIVIPSVVVSLSAADSGSRFDVTALVGLTVVTLVMIGRRDGAGRVAGVGIVAGYLAYIAVRLAIY